MFVHIVACLCLKLHIKERHIITIAVKICQSMKHILICFLSTFGNPPKMKHTHSYH